MDVLIGLVSAIVTLVVSVGSVFFAYRSARSSSKRAEIERQTYVSSVPCQLSAIARIVSVDEGAIGGVSLQVEICNDGLGRAFNIECEARSTFLWGFDEQLTVRNSQTFNLMRRDPAASRAGRPYPPFGFDEQIDIPPHVCVESKYLEPDQRLSIANLFSVPWEYLGHPSTHQLRPLGEALLPGITEEDLQAFEGTVMSRTSENELRDILAKYKPMTSTLKNVDFSSTQYKRDKALPPGLVLYGTFSQHGNQGKAFLFGPGNGLQLRVSFSHCYGPEIEWFALPCPLMILRPKSKMEIGLVKTDANGVNLDSGQALTVY